LSAQGLSRLPAARVKGVAFPGHPFDLPLEEPFQVCYFLLKPKQDVFSKSAARAGL
jgi:hypothetical protein